MGTCVMLAGCFRAGLTLSADTRAELKNEIATEVKTDVKNDIRSDIKADAQAAVGALVDQSRNQTYNEIEPWIAGLCIGGGVIAAVVIVGLVFVYRIRMAQIAAERDEDVAQAQACHTQGTAP